MIIFVSIDHNDHHEADYPSSYYEWRTLYKIFVKKHGGIIPMQNYVLKRCLRNRQALEEHYQLSLHSSRQQKWYQYLEDREMGNHKALKALTEHMRPTTHNYMLHQVRRKRKFIFGKIQLRSSDFNKVLKLKGLWFRLSLGCVIMLYHKWYHTLSIMDCQRISF